ncbi:MAG TPA: hypothetical protein DCY48_00415 [Candidatus Magasanikbacteria bacterium]|nr:MAG: hypothetical protein A3I74_02685 [Candidatus Magasanikbacteria bacterium RIFCSPLOWO2_02_FULL_47_16]OGH79598.1 MAG: hypothetical protein A3C10_00715 [Candidatus Magasanikbacteria bacterium RIFCSPHIGHO2_02_FULL_48_18]HAZ28231.1 hypothetical protein [Candidatus Magasanikbacteria bacterium]
MHLLIATTNPAKFGRYMAIFGIIPNLSLLSLTDISSLEAPDEPYPTAEENARHKAKWYAQRTGYAAFASDEALFVDFLPKKQQPGVFVRRNPETGKSMTDQEVYAYWKEKVLSLQGEHKGVFHHGLCLAMPGGQSFSASVDRPFLFQNPPLSSYIPGWPLSAFFKDSATGKIYAEMTEEEKQTRDIPLQQESLRLVRFWLENVSRETKKV